jgi:hypothetical protein
MTRELAGRALLVLSDAETAAGGSLHLMKSANVPPCRAFTLRSRELDRQGASSAARC